MVTLVSVGANSAQRRRSRRDLWRYLASSVRGKTGWLERKHEGEDRMGIAFLSLVILCVFVYLFYALFRAENF